MANAQDLKFKKQPLHDRAFPFTRMHFQPSKIRVKCTFELFVLCAPRLAILTPKVAQKVAQHVIVVNVASFLFNRLKTAI
jgi:hypothetical protein